MIITFDIEFADRFIPTFCQISIQSWVDRECVDNYTTIISPQSDIEEFMTERHGIRSVDTAGFPTINMIWHEVYDRLNNNIVFIHNANSVIRSLRKMADIERLNLPKFYYICTEQLSKKIWPDLEDYKLATLSKELHLNGENFNAENDARKLGEIINMALNKKEAQGLGHLNYLVGLPIGLVNYGEVITPTNLSDIDRDDITRMINHY